MSQNPTLLPHGKYWTFLYRDSQGIQKRAKVCPREGPGALARSERELKKFAVMGELGLMTGQLSLSTTLAMTFSMAADHYMIGAINRRSRPLGDSTRTGYISYLDNHLKPFLGEMSLDKINNAVVREFVNKMVVSLRRRGGPVSSGNWDYRSQNGPPLPLAKSICGEVWRHPTARAAGSRDCP